MFLRDALQNIINIVKHKERKDASAETAGLTDTQYVEGELREYWTLKAELEQLKQDKADIYNRFNQPKGEPVKQKCRN